MLASIGIEATEVRTAAELRSVDALIIPGGESSAMSRLMQRERLDVRIAERVADGMALMGTCAGAILMSRGIENAIAGQTSLDLIDIDIVRNAYGRQVDSFESEVGFTPAAGGTVSGVFIRAPRISRIGDGVTAVGYHRGEVVAVERDRMLACTFHPELTDDASVHRYFVETVATRG